MRAYIDVDISQCEILQSSAKIQEHISEVGKLAIRMSHVSTNFVCFEKTGENTARFLVELDTSSEEMQQCIAEMERLSKRLSEKAYEFSKLLIPKEKATL